MAANSSTSKSQPEQDHIMGYQKVKNCRDLKKAKAQVEERKERDKMRYLIKKGKKIELLQMKIDQEKKKIQQMKEKLEADTRSIKKKEKKIKATKAAIKKIKS